MHAPAADAADLATAPPHLPKPAPDQMAERAPWAMALAAWMHRAEADVLPLPVPEPMTAGADEMTVEWWHIMPHASDWWM